MIRDKLGMKVIMWMEVYGMNNFDMGLELIIFKKIRHQGSTTFSHLVVASKFPMPPKLLM
jgi:hypothetical protein